MTPEHNTKSDSLASVTIGGNSYIEYGSPMFSSEELVYRPDDAPRFLSSNATAEANEADLRGFRFLGGVALLSPAASKELTLRHRQISVLLAAGIEIDDVATDLNISKSSIKNHYLRIAQKVFTPNEPTAPSRLISNATFHKQPLFVAPEPASATAFRTRLSRLTAREVEVAKLRAMGADMKSIVDELDISLGTTKSHLSRIGNRIGTRSQRALIAAYFVAGELQQ